MPDVQRTQIIGEMGEDTLGRLCIPLRANITPPGKDRMGWDRLIEFPTIDLGSILLDKRPSPLKILCQVKSTDDFSTKKLSMTVAQLDQLVRTPLPAFVVVFEFLQRELPQNCYVCHIDRQRIFEILYRIRKLQSEGHLELHKHSMQLTAKDDELLPTIDSRSFDRSIRNAAGDDANAYAVSKKLICDTVGYTQSKYRMTFRSRASIGELVDASLGDGVLPIEDLVISDVRFENSIDIHHLTSAELRFELVKTGSITLVAQGARASNRSALEFNVAVPPIPGLAVNEIKYKLWSEYISAIIEQPDINFSCSFDWEKPHSLDALLRGLNFICTLADDSCILYAEIDGRRVQMSERQAMFKIANTWFQLRKRLEILRAFLDKIGYRDDLQISVDQLIEQAESLQYMQLVLNPRGQKVVFKFSEDTEHRLNVDGIFATPISFECASATIFAFCSFRGRLNISGDTISARMKTAEVFDSIVNSVIDHDDLWASYKDFQEECQTMAKGNLVLRCLEIHDNEGVVTHSDKVQPP